MTKPYSIRFAEIYRFPVFIKTFLPTLQHRNPLPHKHSLRGLHTLCVRGIIVALARSSLYSALCSYGDAFSMDTITALVGVLLIDHVRVLCSVLISFSLVTVRATGG